MLRRKWTHAGVLRGGARRGAIKRRRTAWIVLAVGLSLLLLTGTALAKILTYKGKAEDDSKVTFDLDTKKDVIEDIFIKNATLTCPSGLELHPDLSFFVMEPVKVNKDGEFRGRYEDSNEEYRFKGHFPQFESGAINLAKAKGNYFAATGETTAACKSGRVDWKVKNQDD